MRPRGAVALPVALLTLAFAPPSRAQTAGIPATLAARFQLGHGMRDAGVLLSRSSDLSLSLQVDAAGAAVFLARGTEVSTVVQVLPLPSPPPPSPPVRYAVEDRWTGRARREGGTLVVLFDRREGGGPAYSVALRWRCWPMTIPTSPAPTPGYACDLDEPPSTIGRGGFPLPPYLQVRVYLAAPEARLEVGASALGGADHRTSDVAYSYARGPEPRAPTPSRARRRRPAR